MSRDWVNEAQQVLGDGESNLTDVLPNIIAKILRDGLWRGRVNKDGVPFSTFDEFASYKIWWGLECPFDRLIRYCEHNAECRELLLREVGAIAEKPGPKGGDGCNTTNSNDRGATYTLRRLKRDNPELAEKVIKGEITAHAAAIAAGIRKQKTALDSLKHWWGKADDRERSEFTRWLHGA